MKFIRRIPPRIPPGIPLEFAQGLKFNSPVFGQGRLFPLAHGISLNWGFLTRKLNQADGDEITWKPCLLSTALLLRRLQVSGRK